MHEIHLDTVDSTNTYARVYCRRPEILILGEVVASPKSQFQADGSTHAAEFPKDQITCVTAEEQTAGRGQWQRPWVSPKGVNLYATFYFRLPAQIKDLIHLAQLLACSFAAVLLSEGLAPKIKLPNDIQLNGKKLSGILCETSFHEEEVDIFLGIGINVNMSADLCAHIDQPATSLKVETGREWDRSLLLKKLQMQFASDLERFKEADFAPFHDFLERLLV